MPKTRWIEPERERQRRSTKRPPRSPRGIAWPPPETYRQMKRIAAEVLPGSRYRRHVLGRYSLIWKKPVTAGLL
jgi:hypothetical protein